jgi:hypothetical protein
MVSQLGKHNSKTCRVPYAPIILLACDSNISIIWFHTRSYMGLAQCTVLGYNEDAVTLLCLLHAPLMLCAYYTNKSTAGDLRHFHGKKLNLSPGICQRKELTLMTLNVLTTCVISRNSKKTSNRLTITRQSCHIKKGPVFQVIRNNCTIKKIVQYFSATDTHNMGKLNKGEQPSICRVCERNATCKVQFLKYLHGL